MDVIVYVIAAATGVATIVTGLLCSDGHHRDAGLWSGCVSVVLIVVGGFCWYQSRLWASDAASTMLIAGSAETPAVPRAGADLLLFPGARERLPELQSQMAPPTNAHFIFLGNSVAWTSADKFQEIVLQQNDEPMIQLEQSDSGISISAKIFTKEGKIACEIVHGKFHINPNNVFRIERPTLSRLIVFNDEARRILDVELINRHACRFLGEFFLRDRCPVIITQEAQLLGPMPMSGSVAVNNKAGAFRIGWPTNGDNPVPDPHAVLDGFTRSMREMDSRIREIRQRFEPNPDWPTYEPQLKPNGDPPTEQGAK